MPGSLKMVWGWRIYPVKGKLAECPGEKTGENQGAGLRFGLSAAGWRLSHSMPWHRSKMICGIWADKLAFHTEQCLPDAGGSEEQMPVKQLAKLPQAAPGQTDARLPRGSICSGCSVLQWRSLSCSLQLIQAPSWLLLSLGSSQLPVGDGCWVRWGSGTASSAALPSDCCNYRFALLWLENETAFLGLGIISHFPYASSLNNWFSFCWWHSLQWNLSPLITTEVNAEKLSKSCLSWRIVLLLCVFKTQ